MARNLCRIAAGARDIIIFNPSRYRSKKTTQSQSVLLSKYDRKTAELFLCGAGIIIGMICLPSGWGVSVLTLAARHASVVAQKKALIKEALMNQMEKMKWRIVEENLKLRVLAESLPLTELLRSGYMDVATIADAIGGASKLPAPVIQHDLGILRVVENKYDEKAVDMANRARGLYTYPPC